MRTDLPIHRWFPNVGQHCLPVITCLLIMLLVLVAKGDDAAVDRKFDDFESGDIKAWVADDGTTVAAEKKNVFKGKFALSAKWSDEDKGWWFGVKKLSEDPEDWQNYSKLRVRFAKDSGAQGLIYLNYKNNGEWVAGTGSVSSFWAKWDQAYTAYELDLGKHARGAVTEVRLFWNDEFGKGTKTGDRTFCFDDIELVAGK